MPGVTVIEPEDPDWTFEFDEAVLRVSGACPNCAHQLYWIIELEVVAPAGLMDAYEADPIPIPLIHSCDCGDVSHGDAAGCGHSFESVVQRTAP